ncbi:MAG TPA: nucleoside triphosphate pyrophosphohydrolase [Vicinamibacteria bacterium]|nr:nucleoside triphosphate pyrophosphohydrolase [Vicinamibacteria bacterium]
MSAGDELLKLMALMARLRSADGCPWDREQTMRSLRPFVLEEAYELVEAIGGGEKDSIREELGDLLLEIVFVNQIAVEEDLFRMEDVIRGIHDKLVRRHPHVFEAERVSSANKALERWEEIKEREKGARASAIDGVAASLAALARAQKVSTRAAKAGFDWQSAGDVKAKVEEELGELATAIASGSASAIEEEMGDILFALSNLARHLEVDAEVALTAAIEKFSRRFRHLESALRAEGRSVKDAGMEELDQLWEAAKRE